MECHGAGGNGRFNVVWHFEQWVCYLDLNFEGCEI